MFNYFNDLGSIFPLQFCKRLAIALACLVFLCDVANGQQAPGARNLDSLLEAHPARDTVRFQLLADKFMEQFYFSPDSSLLTLGDELLSIAEELKGFKPAMAYQRLGIAYDYIFDEPFTALDYYQQSTAVAEAVATKTKADHERKIGFMTSNYANIANIYMKLGDMDRPVEYLHRAIDIRIQEGIAVPHTTYNALSVSYNGKRQYDEALKYGKLALEGSRDDGVHFQANNLNSLATISLYMDSIPQAKRYVEEALSLVEQHDIGLVKPVAYATASGIYSRSGDYAKSERYALAALELFGDQVAHYENRMIAWENLANTYYNTGRFKEAVEAKENQLLLKDSLNNESKKIELSRLEMQYDYEKKEALATAEIQQHKTTRNTIIAGSALLFLIGVGGLVAYKKRQDGLKKQSELAFRASLSKTEMQVLRLQMNPHFIFNSLNSISDYISKNDLESADYYLAKFAKLMRGVLESSEEQEIPLADELQMLQLYMQLEASRLAGKFTHEITVGEGIDTHETLVPPLILQPFVENSIWHGLSRKDGQGKIKIEVTRDGDMINCTVEDDGVGRSPHPAENGQKSYGTNITKDRIDMLNRQKGTQASIRIADLEQGTRVEVRLPYGEVLE